MVRDQKAAGSNPATSTEKPRRIKACGVFFTHRGLNWSLTIMYITMYTTMYITMYKIKKRPPENRRSFYMASMIAWSDS